MPAARALDKSATSRRWKNARARGYLRNLEERRGKPARIVLGDPLPEDIEILPTLERLEERCSNAARDVVRAPERTHLLPGDLGYLDGLGAARKNDDVTEGEWAQLMLFHQMLAGRPT